MGPLDASSVVALIPCHRAPPSRELVKRTQRHVGGLLLVDDGSPDPGRLDDLARETDAELVRLPSNAGKGYAIAAGIEAMLTRQPRPAAVLVLDSDGQHPPDAIPRFLAAGAEAELVVGDRFGDSGAMPWQRRLANRSASRLLSLSTRRAVPDSQCGMRLLRGAALNDVSFPIGGFEAETRHLKQCLRAGLRVAWVPIPAVYSGELSSFRALRDSARVLGALLG